jgi:DNA invertase Pin-like site-specific DNA recombinase
MTRLASVQGDVDLGSEDGQLLARVKGAIDSAEVAKIRRRVKRKMLERADRGCRSRAMPALATRRTRSP